MLDKVFQNDENQEADLVERELQSGRPEDLRQAE